MLTILYIHLPFLKLMEKWSWSGVFLCIDQLFLPFSRVLLERLIVNRPHPWGLLITFIELIKNPAFKFWNHEFVHCAPEIEKWVKSNSFHCFSLKTGEIIIWWLQLGWVIKKGVVAKICKTRFRQAWIFLTSLYLSSFFRLFQSVAQCCMGQKQAQQVMEGTGAS